MATITVSVADDLKAELDKYPEINWAAVLRKAFVKRIELLKRFEKEFRGEL